MKVFLSWSGSESQAIAKVLRDWLPDLLQAIEPWLSSEDIAKGSPWLQGITSEVEVVRYGILCITPLNASSPWICFEAGAMSVAKGIGRQQVVPLLFGLPPGQLSGPIAQFQAAEFNKDDVLRLAQSLNRALGNAGVPAERLSRQFDRLWPDLETRVSHALATSPPPPVKRNQQDMLEEVLEGIRSIIRQQTQFNAMLIDTGVSARSAAKVGRLSELLAADGRGFSDLWTEVAASKPNAFFRPDSRILDEMKELLDGEWKQRASPVDSPQPSGDGPVDPP